MGVKISGFSGLEAALRRMEAKAVQAAHAELHHQGELIADRSQALAPVDEGNLEQAHGIGIERQGNKATVTIAVGGVVGGVDVDNYIDFIHDGEYNLGPKSAEKAASTGQPVGPEFLKRGFDEQEAEIEDAIADAVFKALGL